MLALNILFFLFNTHAQVAIYTGTFDPPHNGHREVIEAAIKKANLETLYVNPGLTLHKPNAQDLSFRLEMTERAFFDLAEVNFPPQRVQNLFWENKYPEAQELLAELNPGKIIYKVMGSDSLLTLAPEEVQKSHIRFLISVRERNFEFPKELKPLLNKKIFLLPIPELQVSSTQVRNEIKDGITPVHLTSEVSEMIRIAGVYRSDRCKVVFQK